MCRLIVERNLQMLRLDKINDLNDFKFEFRQIGFFQIDSCLVGG